MVDKYKYQIVLNQQPQKNIFISLGAIVLSCAIGALVVLDKDIANNLSHILDFTIGGENILKLFPYEITLLLFVAFVSLWFVKPLLKIFYKKFFAVFAVLIIIMSQTTALHNLGRLDGFDLITGLFLLALIIMCLVSDFPIHIGIFDILSFILIAIAGIGISIAGVKQLININLLLKAYLVAFLIANFIVDRKTLNLFIKCFIIVTTISAVIGIFQEIIYLSTGDILIGIVDRLSMKNFFEDTSIGYFLRVPAFTELYKNLNYLLIMCTTLITAIIAYRWEEIRPIHRILLCVALILVYTGVFLTFSTDGLLGCLIGTCICIVWRWPSLIFISIGGILCYSAAGLLFGFFGDIFDGLLSYTKLGEGRIRIQLACEGIERVFYRHPLLGVGINQAPYHISNIWRWPPHNILINIAAEMGIIGLVVYISLIGHILWSSFRLCLFATSVEDKAICIGLFCGFIGCFFCLQFHGTYIHSFIWMFFGIVIAYKRIISSSRLPEELNSAS